MTCVHHRILETPNGPTVQGCCKKCGAGRDYQSSLEQVTFTKGAHVSAK